MPGLDIDVLLANLENLFISSNSIFVGIFRVFYILNLSMNT
jgi:hypothetical protein